MDEELIQPEISMPEMPDWDSEEVFRAGYEAMTGAEQEETWELAQAKSKPAIITDPQGVVRYQNTSGMPDPLAAAVHATQGKPNALTPESYGKAVRTIANEILADPQNQYAQDGDLANYIAARTNINGLQDVFFSNIADPEERKAAFTTYRDGIIAKCLQTRSSKLAEVCKNAITNFHADGANDSYITGRARFDESYDNYIKGINDSKFSDDEKKDLVANVKEERRLKENAINAEIQLRAQDDLAAYLAEHPEATDAEKYAVIRNSARANYKEVNAAVMNGELDYLTKFAQDRDAATKSRAALYAQESAAAQKDLALYKQAGEAKKIKDDTEAARAKVQTTEIRKAANATEKAEFLAANPQVLATQQGAADTVAAMKKEIKNGGMGTVKYESGKSVAFNVGRTNTLADEPPTLVMPMAEYQRMMQQMGVDPNKKEGITVTIGSGKNAHTYAVRGGKVKIPAMNNAMFSQVYLGKRNKLTTQDIALRCTGYRNSLRFYKTRAN